MTALVRPAFPIDPGKKGSKFSAPQTEAVESVSLTNDPCQVEAGLDLHVRGALSGT